MSKNSKKSNWVKEHLFVLGYRTKTETGEKKIFALKNPRRSTLVDMETGEKVKKFSTYKKALEWARKINEKEIEGLRSVSVIPIKKPLPDFPTSLDNFLENISF